MNFLPLKSGVSVEGDEIPALKNEVKSNKHVYLIAGTHGDEVEGVYCLDKLLSWIRGVDIPDLPLIVVPILNVDGYRSGSRVNSHGVDLNRNFPSSCWSSKFKDKKYNPGNAPLSEPETMFLTKLFEKFNPAQVITFHSWKPMLNYNGNCKALADFVSSYNSYKVVSEIEGHTTPGSLGNFAPKEYAAPVLTVELPELNDDIMLKDIWKENEVGFKEMLMTMRDLVDLD